LISEQTIMIEPKNINAFPMPNRIGWGIAGNPKWLVPVSASDRRHAVFAVSDYYTRGGGSKEEERQKYFKALFTERRNGGLAAMLYDLTSQKRREWLGDWHPRQILETEARRRQKIESLKPLEQWLENLLQEGILPGISLSGVKDFAETQTLLEHAKEKVAQLRLYLSPQSLKSYLEDWKCVAHRAQTKEAISKGSPRGMIFPPLQEFRAKWAERYEGWDWDDPNLMEWRHSTGLMVQTRW
jgi:hypothetical protein